LETKSHADIFRSCNDSSH